MHWARNFSYRILHPLWIKDAAHKVEILSPHVAPGSRLLEIGCGPGTVYRELIDSGYNTESLDVEDQRIAEDLPAPILYDGELMPFQDREFDLSLLFCVLHHCSDPISVFREATRVSKRVAIIEDVFSNPFQLRLTQITDSLVNGEFLSHPHQQKSELQWREVFDAEGWQVEAHSTWPLFGIFRQAFFLLKPENSA